MISARLIDHKTSSMVFSPLMKNCFLFPGQGAQYPGMAKDLWEKSSAVKDLLAKASDASGVDVQKLLFDSTAEELRATDKTQIAITVANLAASAALKEKGVQPKGCAGFSLGEYAALCESGVLRLQDVFPIVKLRGILMEKAARALGEDAESSGMAVVLGLPAEKVASTVESLEAGGVYVANLNSPVQTVVSGTAAGLEAAGKALKEAGAKRYIRLPVSGPFHSPYMNEARKLLDEALAAYAFADPVMPVYSNVTGKAIRTGAEARELCGKQVVSPVRWVSVQESLFSDGFDAFFEAGPGTVLTGLMKALNPQAACSPAGTAEAVTKAAGGS